MKILTNALLLCTLLLIGLDTYATSLLPQCPNGHPDHAVIEKFSPCQTQALSLHYLEAHDLSQLVMYLIVLLTIALAILLFRRKKPAPQFLRIVIITTLSLSLIHLVLYGYRAYKLETAPIILESCTTNAQGVATPCT